MQQHVGLESTHRRRESGPVKDITDDRFGAQGSKPVGLAGRTGQGADRMTRVDQQREKSGSDDAGCAREENAARIRSGGHAVNATRQWPSRMVNFDRSFVGQS
jgi:hypothetical protein